MNKQEIIDNLRLQISDRDMALIDLNAKLRNAVDLLKTVKEKLYNMDIVYHNAVDSAFYEEVCETIERLIK